MTGLQATQGQDQGSRGERETGNVEEEEGGM